MVAIERKVQTNADGYREVALDYRMARAAMLDRRSVAAKSGRIACPMLDASRSDSAYGRMALPGTRGKDLAAWAEALGTSVLGIKIVAYLSGPLWKAPRDFLFGRFDDGAVNTGFIRSLKHGINTGIVSKTSFDQHALDEFVGAVRPELENTRMTDEWIYSEASGVEYLDRSMLPAIRAHNKTKAAPGLWGRGLGLWLSTFEMKTLLLGVLAQPIPKDPKTPTRTVPAILLRDVHDLYKYGWIPAAAEGRLHAAGLLDFPVVDA